MNITNKYSKKVYEQFEELKRGVIDFHVSEELLVKISGSFESSKPLRIKAGFDPTAPDLHIGHTVVLNKLRQFQDFGHIVMFVIGDFTGMIGDPTGKCETRKPLTKEDVDKNAQTYKEQVFKILKPELTEVCFNSEWLSTLNAREMILLTAKYSVNRMMERDDFKHRFREGLSIGIHEFLYPLFQAYDSVALQADVELGGTDQLFNLLIGRNIQRDYGQIPQVVMTMPLLEGTDAKMVDCKLMGHKMSKSLGNYIGITEPPTTMFLKIMSISDDLMWRYYELLTSLKTEEIKKIHKNVLDGKCHPKEVKVNLAFEIVKRFHGIELAMESKEKGLVWLKERKMSDEDIEVITYVSNNLEVPFYKLCAETKLAESCGEAKRKIKEGAVWFGEKEDNMTRVTDERFFLPSKGDFFIRFGRKKFLKVKIIPHE